MLQGNSLGQHGNGKRIPELVAVPVNPRVLEYLRPATVGLRVPLIFPQVGQRHVSLSVIGYLN
jgi:hypothetical protein